MEPDLACHVLAPNHVVIELHERLTAPGPALELHVVAGADGEVVAWWGDERGRSLRAVPLSTC